MARKKSYEVEVDYIDVLDKSKQNLFKSEGWLQEINDYTQPYHLYIVVDAKLNLTKNFLESKGINICMISENIGKVEQALIYETEPFIVVVIENRTSHLTTGASQKKLENIKNLADITIKNFVITMGTSAMLTIAEENKAFRFSPGHGSYHVLSNLLKLKVNFSTKKIEEQTQTRARRKSKAQRDKEDGVLEEGVEPVVPRSPQFVVKSRETGENTNYGDASSYIMNLMNRMRYEMPQDLPEKNVKIH